MATPMKTIRTERGMTQQQVADEAGMSRSHYAEIEAGKKPFNSYKAINIARALGAEPGDLYPVGEVPTDAADKEEFMDLLDRLGQARFERMLDQVREQVRLEELDRAQKRGESGDASG